MIKFSRNDLSFSLETLVSNDALSHRKEEFMFGNISNKWKELLRRKERAQKKMIKFSRNDLPFSLETLVSNDPLSHRKEKFMYGNISNKWKELLRRKERAQHHNR